MPIASVVIATLNREEPLCQTLRGLMDPAVGGDCEILVMDQTRELAPETAAFLRGVAGRVDHVRLPYRNVSRARNDGAARAKSEVLLFLDDDVVMPPGFVAAHARCYEDPSVACVTGPRLSPGEKALGRAEVGAEWLRKLERQEDARFDVDFAYVASYAPSCNMSVRKRVFGEVGGFDENVLAGAYGFEDAELCHRLKKRGWPIHYRPEAGLVHLSAPTGGCRDVMDPWEYHRRLIANTHYFAWKVEMSPWKQAKLVGDVVRARLRKCPRWPPFQAAEAALRSAGSVLGSIARLRRLKKLPPPASP
jgi:GT2 family glycosyltransferase